MGLHHQGRLSILVLRTRILRWSFSAIAFAERKSTLDNSMASLWHAMHTARAQACFGLGQATMQPVLRYRHLQTQLRHAEATRRVLMDFWKSPQIDGQDYFACLSTLLLKDTPMHQRADLQALVNAKCRAAPAGVQLDAACQPVWDRRTPRVTACRVNQVNAELPTGLAALQILSSAGQQVLSPITQVPLNTSDASKIIQVPTRLPDPMRKEEQVRAQVSFRVTSILRPSMCFLKSARPALA